MATTRSILFLDHGTGRSKECIGKPNNPITQYRSFLGAFAEDMECHSMPQSYNLVRCSGPTKIQPYLFQLGAYGPIIPDIPRQMLSSHMANLSSYVISGLSPIFELSSAACFRIVPESSLKTILFSVRCLSQQRPLTCGPMLHVGVKKDVSFMDSAKTECTFARDEFEASQKSDAQERRAMHEIC